MTQAQSGPEEAEQLFAGFVEGFKSLMLATTDAQGLPNASYAPFVRDEQGCFYILTSRLSAHTRNLLAVPRAALLLVEDESRAPQIFARKRASYHCAVEILDTNDAAYAPMIERMRTRHGEIVDVLTGLPDFILFRLRPESGRFVIGFGRAFTLHGERLERLQAIGPPGA